MIGGKIEAEPSQYMRYFYAIDKWNIVASVKIVEGTSQCWVIAISLAYTKRPSKYPSLSCRNNNYLTYSKAIYDVKIFWQKSCALYSGMFIHKLL